MICQIGHRRRLLRMICAAGVAAQWSGAHAQFPSSPTKGQLIFGIPPGAAGTTLAEGFLAQMAAGQGPRYELQRVLGRDGRKSVEALKQARPDGQTLLLAQSALVTIFPSVYRELGYSPQRDLTPLAALSEYAFMLIVGPRVPTEVTTLDGYLRWVGDNPAFRQIGVNFRGAQGWLMGRQLARSKDAPLQLISYAGAAPIISDLLGGNLAAGFVNTGNAVNARAAGRVRTIAVSSAQRWMGLPDTPTFTEYGLEDMVMTGWYGVFAPAGMPEETQTRLREIIASVLQTPAMADTLASLSMLPMIANKRQIIDRIERETNFYAGAIQRTRLERI